MRYAIVVAAVLLTALGCSRTEPQEAPESGTRERPGPALLFPPAAPDDGGIPPPRPVPVRTPAQALALGVDYLLAQQSKDGAWRSDVYATFKDGTGLTPLAVTALQEAHDAGVRNAATEAAIKKGCEFLAAF